MLRAELVAEKAKSEDQTTLTLTLTHELRLQVRSIRTTRAHRWAPISGVWCCRVPCAVCRLPCAFGCAFSRTHPHALYRVVRPSATLTIVHPTPPLWLAVALHMSMSAGRRAGAALQDPGRLAQGDGRHGGGDGDGQYRDGRAEEREGGERARESQGGSYLAVPNLARRSTMRCTLLRLPSLTTRIIVNQPST